jgi:hypothetical protein
MYTYSYMYTHLRSRGLYRERDNISLRIFYFPNCSTRTANDFNLIFWPYQYLVTNANYEAPHKAFSSSLHLFLSYLFQILQ